MINNFELTIPDLVNLLKKELEEKPVFSFALREDIKDEKQFLPQKSEPAATGWDVRSAQPDRKPLIIKPGEYFKIPLGFRAFPPNGWWFQLNPRSSSFTKKHMHNLIGIIDEHYPEEVLFAGQYIAPPLTEDNLIINFGDAIAQIIPIRRVDMIVVERNNNEYNDLCRKRQSIRTGGFGSTG